MNRVRCVIVAVGLSLAATGIARGQTPEDLAQQGIRSFRRAEFEAAAALFRRALELPPRDTVGLQRRIQILDYLAAAELFRGKRDTAVVVFRRVVQAEPRHRVDEVVFPPEVSSLLDDVRRATKAIAVSIPADTILPLGGGTWSVRLLGTSFQTAIATVTTDNAIPIRELYSGPLDDSLTVRWNGTDSFGRAVNSGPYELSVVSMSAGRRTRLLRVPLKITNITPDTIPIPASIPDSLLLPERVNGRRAFGALLGGAALGAATSILPLIVSKGARPTPVRFMVGGAVGLAGIIGFALHPPSRPIEQNITANRLRRDAWLAEMQRARAENARRRAIAGTRIQASTATATGSGVP